MRIVITFAPEYAEFDAAHRGAHRRWPGEHYPVNSIDLECASLFAHPRIGCALPLPIRRTDESENPFSNQ